MANYFNWQLGHEGKGNVYDDGSISTWNINRNNEPHHFQKGQEDEKTPRFHFYLSPEGGLWDGGTTFNNRTPHNDDQVVADVVAQHPSVHDARHELSMDWDGEPEERVEMPGGGFGHAYNFLEAMSKVAAGDDWPDFHTEFKIPRGVRKQIRRWVDRLKWPEGSTKMDAREYHITVLDMEEYDEEFAKWARSQVRDKTFHFKSTKMDIFGETVVVRLDCPEWDAIALEWGEKAEARHLEPHRFPGGPKAHISVGKSPGRKWPRGIPNPHVKFDTRMFNVKKNSGSSVETTPAEDLKLWLDSFTPEQAQPPSLHHTDGDDFTPQIVAPVVQTPHVDPPSKPYVPYNWAEEGWEESPLDRVSTGPQPLPMDDQLYYRAHHADAPFGIEHAQSAPIEGADIPEQYITPKEGYSAFWNPHHLRQYMDEIGWDTNQRNVVAFRGKAVGSGVDGEPLVMPHTDQPETTMPYQDFLHRLEYTPNGYGQWHEHTWGDGPNGQQVDDGYRTLGEIFESAIDTHICPKCGEDSNSPICATCGHDPQNSPNDYQQMKNDWYDRAWSVPGNQPRPVPNQPMHWRDDHAKNVSLARKETNDLDHPRKWSVESVTSAWQPINDMSSVWRGESNSIEIDQGKDSSTLPGLRSSLSSASSLRGWHGF